MERIKQQLQKTEIVAYMHIWSLGPIHTFFDCNNKLASTSLKFVLPYITSALFHVCTFAIKWLTRLYPL